MTERQVKWIFGVLALLIAVYVGVQWAGGRDADGGRLGLAAAVDGPPEVVRLLRADGDSVRLEIRRDTAWVNGFPADSAAVASLFAALDAAEAEELVSRNPDNFGRLGVTEEEADRVVIGPAASPAFTFLLGGSGRGGRFVRKPDAERVYLLEGSAATSLGRGLSRWRNRAIASVDTGRVSRLLLERDGQRTTFVRDSAGWRAAGSGSVDAPEAGTVLDELVELRASSSVPADSALRAADFGSPDALLRAWSSADGGGAPLLELRLVRAGEDGGYLVRRGDSPYVYPLADYRVDRLFPDE